MDAANCSIIYRNHITTSLYAPVVDSATNVWGAYFDGSHYLVSQRGTTIAGTQYSGATFNAGNNIRTDAWALRDVGMCAGILPDKAYEGGSNGTHVTQYFRDLRDVSYNAANAYTALLPAYAKNNGMWNETSSNGDGQGSQFNNGYLMASVAMTYAINENSNALTFYNYLVKYQKWMRDNFGAWHLSAYSYPARLSNVSASPYGQTYNPYATDTSIWGAYSPLSITWVSGTPGTFTYSSNPVPAMDTNSTTATFLLGTTHSMARSPVV